MAVIGTIRKQSGLLIILVGLAMVLFILSDLTSSGGSLFGSQETVLGQIRGHEVSQREFELKVEEEIAKRYGLEGAPEAAKDGIRQRIWQQLIQEHILFAEYDRLGLSVSANELMDQVRNTQPGSVLYNYFTDPQTGQVIEQFRDPQTGGLNSQAVIGAIQQLLDSENAAEWLDIEKAIEQDRKYNKYQLLVVKGLTATGNDASQSFNEKNAKRNFDYVVREFASIPDEEIEVSDSDLNAWYSKHNHEKRFEQGEETRSLEYVVFDVLPSDEDIQIIKEDLSELLPLFAADSNDTAFVAENAYTPVQSSIQILKEEDLPVSIKDTLANSQPGTVFGPYDVSGRIQISKLTAINYAPDSVRARHILINVQAGDTNALAAANAKLDSLKSVIESKKNFEDMAKEFSQDPGSGAQGGDLNWFGKGRMVPPFEKACFEGEVGDMPIVVSQFGVHLIEITDQTEDKKQFVVAHVDRLKEPSKNTTDAVYKEASTFAIENSSGEKFKEAGSAKGIQNASALRIEDEAVGTLSNAREIVRWAYDNEIGAVSDPIELENRFVIATVNNVRPKGSLPLSAVETEVKIEVIREKKAEKIISDLGTFSTLSDAGKAMGTEVLNANDVFFNSASMPGGLGRELEVLGTVFALDQGTISSPIVGARGVFVLSVTGIETAPGDADFATEKSTATADLETRAQRSLYQALQDEAEIEDNRGRYY